MLSLSFGLLGFCVIRHDNLFSMIPLMKLIEFQTSIHFLLLILSLLARSYLGSQSCSCLVLSAEIQQLQNYCCFKQKCLLLLLMQYSVHFPFYLPITHKLILLFFFWIEMTVLDFTTEFPQKHPTRLFQIYYHHFKHSYLYTWLEFN